MSKEGLLTALKILLIIQKTIAEDWTNPAVNIGVVMQENLHHRGWGGAVAMDCVFKPFFN